MKPQADTSFSTTLMSNSYKGYTFDNNTGKKGKSLDVEIPDWIVKNTNKALVEKNAILEELDAEYELFKKLSRASPSYRFSYTESSDVRDSLPKELKEMEFIDEEDDFDENSELTTDDVLSQ